MTTLDTSSRVAAGREVAADGVSPGPASPRRLRRVTRATLIETVGSFALSLVLMLLVFVGSGTGIDLGFFVSLLLTFLTVYGTVSWRRHGVLLMKDRLATIAVWSGALVGLTALCAVIGYVVAKGAPVAFARFPHFFVADMSKNGGLEPVTAVGAGAAMMGTIEQVGIATAISVPMAVLTAVFLARSRNALARVVGNVVDAMTGTPSIIAGLFIYLIWVEPHKTNGKSGLAAGLALSILMLPIVTRASLEMIKVVPGSLREAALALGAPLWRVELNVVVPAARTGLITAAILGVARTAGETAEVLFTAGGNTHYNLNPFSGNQDSLPFRIYEQIQQPSLYAIREAWGVAFVLLVVVLSLFVLARSVGSLGARPRRRRRASRGS
jgi:phosphate transport system permease protein